MWGWLPQYGQAIFVSSTIIAAVFGGIGIAATFVSAIVGYQLTELSGQEAAIQIENARTEAAKANRDAAQAQLQSEQLRRRLVWRMLDLTQQVQLADELRQFAPQAFSVVVYDRNDQEAANLGDEIWETLKLAGWEFRETEVGASTSSGLELAWANSSGKAIESAMHAVEKAFKAVGIAPDRFTSTETYEGVGPLLFFMVGKRPVTQMELSSFAK